MSGDPADPRFLRFQAATLLYKLPFDRPSALLVPQYMHELFDWVDKADGDEPGRILRLVRGSPDEPPPAA
jgi:hypothetical protein